MQSLNNRIYKINSNNNFNRHLNSNIKYKILNNLNILKKTELNNISYTIQKISYIHIFEF